jgi:ubiquinone/menaquinone biosynthesis C-methylase UbiE
MNEEREILKRYNRRSLIHKAQQYSFFKKDHLFLVQERTRFLLNALLKYRKEDTPNLKILDVGCGDGPSLRDFIQWGARSENLAGIDLLAERIELAKKISPNINFLCANAEKIDSPDKSFDIVLQFTCFSSILDDELKNKVAQEMLRVLKDDGLILWYDFKYNNPANPDVWGIKKSEIKKLFVNCQFDFRLITLAPPIARRLVPVSWILVLILNKFKLLNTHYLAVIRKK